MHLLLERLLMKPVFKLLLLAILATSIISGCSQSVDDQLNQAERYLTEGRMTKAKQIYDKLALEAPDMPYALFGEAMIDEYYGFDWEALVKQLDAAKMDSGYYPAMKAFTRVALRLGYVGKADKMGLLMIQRQPQNQNSYLYYGQIELARNNFRVARANVNTAAKMTDDQTLIILAKAEISLHSGNKRLREEALTALTNLDLKSSEHFQYIASIFNYLNMNDSARHYITRGISADRDNQKLKLDLAQYYFEDGFYLEAKELVNNIIDEAEFYGPAYQLGAYILMAQGHEVEAEELLSHMIMLKRDSPIGIEKLGDLNSYFKNPVMMATNYQAAYIKATNLLYPDDYLKQVYSKMMNAFFADRDYGAAIDFYREGQERFPGDSMAYFWAAELSQRFPEDTASARFDPEDLFDQNWNNQFWLEKVARMYSRTKRQDLAMKTYGQLVILPQVKLDYFTSYLNILTGQKDVAKIDSLSAIVPFRFQNNSRLLEKFMVAYRAVGMGSKELKYTKLLYDLSPGNLKTVVAMAKLYLPEEKEKARALFALYTDKYPQEPDGFYRLARLEYDFGINDSVWARVNHVLELDQRHAPAMELKGRVFQDEGLTDSMVLYYDKAINSSGRVPEAYYYLAQYHFEEGTNLIKAAGLAMGAVNQFDSDSRGHKLLGQIYYAQKKYAMALGQFSLGTTLYDAKGEMYFYLGQTQLKLDDKKKAKKALLRALDLGLEKSMTDEARKLVSQI